MLLTASSRPIVMLSFPLRSNSWLSASTISLACRVGAAVDATASDAWTGCGVGVGATFTGAGAPIRLTPQLEQNASPAGLVAPQDGHVCVPVWAGGDATAAGACVFAATDGALL